jgi:hypothetical protein
MTITATITETLITATLTDTTVTVAVTSVPVVSTLTVSDLQALVVPMGEISYFSMTGTSISIAAQSDGSTNLVKAAPVTTFVDVMDFDNGGSDNGRLRYIGVTEKDFHIACTISIASSSANDTFVFSVAKNGTALPAAKVLLKIQNASDIKSTAMHVTTSMTTNDYLEMFVGNTTDADDCTVHTFNLFAMGM